MTSGRVAIHICSQLSLLTSQVVSILGLEVVTYPRFGRSHGRVIRGAVCVHQLGAEQRNKEVEAEGRTVSLTHMNWWWVPCGVCSYFLRTLFYILTRNLAIANRLCIHCTHNMSRPSIVAHLYLDLVSSVALGSLAPFWTDRCNIFNLLPLEVDHLQILLESSVPHLFGVSCFMSAIRWSPGHCHIRRLMIW